MLILNRKDLIWKWGQFHHMMLRGNSHARIIRSFITTLPCQKNKKLIIQQVLIFYHLKRKGEGAWNQHYPLNQIPQERSSSALLLLCFLPLQSTKPASGYIFKMEPEVEHSCERFSAFGNFLLSTWCSKVTTLHISFQMKSCRLFMSALHLCIVFMILHMTCLQLLLGNEE